MRITPRHEFVPSNLIDRAYFDMSLPIGDHQTISPPMLVGYMSEQLDPQPNDRVLEIGTGSGYQAAVLSPLVKEVDSIEIVESLGKRAERTLMHLNYKNVFTKVGDGYLGWPEKAAVRQDYCHLLPRKSAPAADRSASRRGPHDYSGGRTVSTSAPSAQETRRQTDQRSARGRHCSCR